jgi:hypothetical protein
MKPSHIQLSGWRALNRPRMPSEPGVRERARVHGVVTTPRRDLRHWSAGVWPTQSAGIGDWEQVGSSDWGRARETQGAPAAARRDVEVPMGHWEAASAVRRSTCGAPQPGAAGGNGNGKHSPSWSILEWGTTPAFSRNPVVRRPNESLGSDSLACTQKCLEARFGVSRRR